MPPTPARSAIRSHAEAAVQSFVERFRISLITPLDGKGVVAETHPLAAGVFSESGHASASKVFREADVVLAVGNSPNQHATFGLREDLFDGKVLIQVNTADTEIGKTYVPDHRLVPTPAWPSRRSRTPWRGGPLRPGRSSP
ncbi:hypothetical protein ABZ299_27730 [Streptomyces sp. NPDC006184]|uniref:hypothetical protein n=1 Tax=Streptomyces sp. NPDC006184 TaxID=3155455 RepID=UPI0033AA58D8